MNKKSNTRQGTYQQTQSYPQFGQSPVQYPTGTIGGGLTPTFPTGKPTGPVYSPVVAPTPGPSMTTTENILYTPAYLKTQIGRKVKVEFLIGTSMLVDREGTLVGVGASYILIQETETDDILLADLYSIKFVKFFY